MGQTDGSSEALSPIVPGYEITGILGRGGMGVVYGARRVIDGEPVALKLPHLSGTEAEVEKRLLREGRAASKLTGRHVARVLEVGLTDRGAPFLALELLTGRDLARVLREDGPIPMRTAAEWLAQACDGLAEAHRNHVIHRDLKPSNLFLANVDDVSQPVIKILDFGLARAFQTADSGTDSTLTRSDAVIGSPRYLAPEVVRDADSAGPRSDVWSIGVVLYELCTGRPPFLAPTTAGVLARIVAEDPTPLQQLLPTAPGALIRIVETALQKDPARRHPSMEVLGRELRTLAENTRPSPPRSRRALGFGLGVAVVVLTSILAITLRSKPKLAATARDETLPIPASAAELPTLVATQPTTSASVSIAPKAAVQRPVRRDAPKSPEPAPKTAFDSPTVENRK